MYKQIIIICAVMSFVSVFPLSYSFYIALRFTFFACLLLLLFTYYKKEKQLNILTLALFALAILYNPFFLIHLAGGKESWTDINFATIVFMYWFNKNKINNTHSI